MTTTSDNAAGRDLARKLVTYLESVCPPPGHLRWQDYLTGDDYHDAPVLRGAARALGLTVTQLLDRAVAWHSAPAVKRTFAPCSTGASCAADVRASGKRVAARFRREPAMVLGATCMGGLSDAY